MWTCHVKKDIRSSIFSEAFVNLNVAAPYSLSVDIPSQLKFTNPTINLENINTDDIIDWDTSENETTTQMQQSKYASCFASSIDGHGGGVDPEITWFVNGIELKNISSDMLQQLVS